MASLFALGCGSSSETLSPPPPASAVVVVDPAPDSIQPCDLVDGARASELLGITVAERRVPPEDDASLCDYLADGGEPVVRLSLATGSTRDQFDDRLASRLLPGEELRPVATAADVAFWNPGRRILVALREDVVVQVIYIGPRFTADEEGSVVARTLVDALVSGIDALGRGPTVTPPPEPVFADLPGRDLSARSYEDNLLAKVQAGEWTLAAGLIQTLQLLAGEVPETGVLRDPATFAGFEATGIIAMGYEYVRDGDDPAARTEISRLLERLVFTPDRLAAMADSESTASSRPVGTGIQLASWSSAEASPVEDCASFYDGWAVPAGVADCLRVELVEASGTTFSIYVPDLDAVDVGWTEAHPDMVRQTIADTVGPFNELGSLPSQMAIVFSAAKHARAAMQAIQPPGQDWCTVTIFTNVLKNDDETLRFLVSHEFGHCFQNATMPDQQVPVP
ncbi:MAG TPA: hypothetical protein VM243_16570, partial [Phycisphaerae bacterium]|nr:hypothetical protein [Phycisphaerae bacterium]